MANACEQLCKWPENVLKILHVVFIFVPFIMWASGGGILGVDILLVIPLIIGAIVLIWYIFEDPGRYKLALLIYYIVAAVLTGVAAIYVLVLLCRYGFYVFGIVVLVFIILGCACYIISAVLNGKNGKP